MRTRSRLLPGPSGHSTLDLFLAQDPPGCHVVTAAVDLLSDVQVVLNLLERGILGKLIKERAHVFLG